jgi:hypothetical protein
VEAFLDQCCLAEVHAINQPRTTRVHAHAVSPDGVELSLSALGTLKQQSFILSLHEQLTKAVCFEVTVLP